MFFGAASHCLKLALDKLSHSQAKFDDTHGRCLIKYASLCSVYVIIFNLTIIPCFLHPKSDIMSVKVKDQMKTLPTVCFIDLDQGSEMIIFESILTTFIESIIFGKQIVSRLKLNHLKQIKLASIGETHCSTKVMAVGRQKDRDVMNAFSGNFL